jgi:carboxyl-terminal processing protease
VGTAKTIYEFSKAAIVGTSAAIVAFHAIDSFTQKPNIDTAIFNRDMGGIQPAEALRRILNFAQTNHYLPHSDIEMQRILRRSMHTLMGPHHNYPKSNQELVEIVAASVMRNLDAHSNFYTPNQNQKNSDSISGTGRRVGVDLSLNDNILTIDAVLEKSPADKAHIQVGDQILEIDGRDMDGMNLSGRAALLNGEPDSIVTLKIKRGDQNPITIAVKREIINEPLVTYKLLEGDIGYIKLESFGENVSQDIRSFLHVLQQNAQGGIKGLIFDLRYNHGGYLDEAVAVSDIFLKTGIITSEIGRDNNVIDQFSAHENRRDFKGKLIVLINGESASASELTTAALKDNGRAIVMGTQSFGKGSVQSINPLDIADIPPDIMPGYIRETFALYHGPSGYSPQLTGVIPNIEVKIDGESFVTERDQLHVIPNPAGAQNMNSPNARCEMSDLTPDQMQNITRSFNININNKKVVDTVLLCAVAELTGQHPYTTKTLIPVTPF